MLKTKTRKSKRVRSFKPNEDKYERRDRREEEQRKEAEQSVECVLNLKGWAMVNGKPVYVGVASAMED